MLIRHSNGKSCHCIHSSCDQEKRLTFQTVVSCIGVWFFNKCGTLQDENSGTRSNVLLKPLEGNWESLLSTRKSRRFFKGRFCNWRCTQSLLPEWRYEIFHLYVASRFDSQKKARRFTRLQSYRHYPNKFFKSCQNYLPARKEAELILEKVTKTLKRRGEQIDRIKKANGKDCGKDQITLIVDPVPQKCRDSVDW
jgi:hypothetical protein